MLMASARVVRWTWAGVWTKAPLSLSERAISSMNSGVPSAWALMRARNVASSGRVADQALQQRLGLRAVQVQP